MKFAEAQFAVTPPPPRWLWLVAIAAVLAASAVWAWALLQRREAESAQLAAMREREARSVELARAMTPSVPPPYEASAREFLRQRDLPWPEALTALENVAIGGVLVRSVEMQANDSSIRAEIAAPTHARVIEYLEALNAGADENLRDLRWSLLQSQAEPSGTQVTAILNARRSAEKGALNRASEAVKGQRAK